MNITLLTKKLMMQSWFKLLSWHDAISGRACQAAQVHRGPSFASAPWRWKREAWILTHSALSISPVISPWPALDPDCPCHAHLACVHTTFSQIAATKILICLFTIVLHSPRQQCQYWFCVLQREPTATQFTPNEMFLHPGLLQTLILVLSAIMQ